MTPIPETYDYQELGALAPDPDEPDDLCQWCGNYFCTPDCTPRFVSPYLAARSRGRRENGDPES